ncbi:unnamed protein product [Heligmosomoides polygyrus]|uniref:ArsR family transcriptional regulator n=1 Tax=Heligmosomoides polygyrus TaxID=6339 RepID=A0A183FJ78_HELPZ|nr:unnamed protein product [Heligmosomoides polygyrus]
MVSLRTRSERITPAVNLSTFVSITLRRLSISFVTDQHSDRSFRSGRESDVDNERQLVESDPRRTTRELAEDMGVHYAAIARHLHQLGKVH